MKTESSLFLNFSKKISLGILVHVFVALLTCSAHSANEELLFLPERRLPISPRLAFEIPADLEKCLVYSGEDFWNQVQLTNSSGRCEWISLRPQDDLLEDKPLEIQFEKPLIIKNASGQTASRPLVISNDTGRQVVFRRAKNGGCALILRKSDVALIGFTFEGALCHDATPSSQLHPLNINW